jgi:hypothetical protein
MYKDAADKNECQVPATTSIDKVLGRSVDKRLSMTEYIIKTRMNDIETNSNEIRDEGTILDAQILEENSNENPLIKFMKQRRTRCSFSMLIFQHKDTSEWFKNMICMTIDTKYQSLFEALVSLSQSDNEKFTIFCKRLI